VNLAAVCVICELLPQRRVYATPMTYQDHLRGRTPGSVLSILAQDNVGACEEDNTALPLQEFVVEDDLGGLGTRPDLEDPALLLRGLARGAQDLAATFATVQELVAQQDLQDTETTIADLASRPALREELLLMGRQTLLQVHPAGTGPMLQLDPGASLIAVNAQSPEVAVADLAENLNAGAMDPIAPQDAQTLPPPTDVNEIAARLGELVDQHTDDMGGAEADVAAARSHVQEAVGQLLDARQEGKVDDWMFYIIGAWLLSKFIPQCHLHFHIGKTAKAGITAVRVLSAATTPKGLAVVAAGGVSIAPTATAAAAGGTTAIATTSTVAGSTAGVGTVGAVAAAETTGAAAAGGAAAGGGAVAAEGAAGGGALAVGLTAVGVAALVSLTIATIVWWVEGFASSCSLSSGEGHGTCSIEQATVVVISEEGIGKCYYYLYESEGDAVAHAGKWRATSRILFLGFRTQQLTEHERWGPAMPYKTIRGAAEKMEETLRSGLEQLRSGI